MTDAGALLADARTRSEISSLADETLLPEKLACLYLGISAKQMKNLRASGGGPAFFKPIGNGARAANMKVSYELGALRRWRSERVFASNLDAAVKSGFVG
jgi:hypothetical protein